MAHLQQSFILGRSSIGPDRDDASCGPETTSGYSKSDRTLCVVQRKNWEKIPLAQVIILFGLACLVACHNKALCQPYQVFVSALSLFPDRCLSDRLFPDRPFPDLHRDIHIPRTAHRDIRFSYLHVPRPGYYLSLIVVIVQRNKVSLLCLQLIPYRSQPGK